jgi:hypothetical protein
VPIFREAHNVFFDAFDDVSSGCLRAFSLPAFSDLFSYSQTASTRFRGKGPNEITPFFLFTHYLIEKHREALLYSYLILRSDSNSDGVLSTTERRLLLSHLKANNSADESTSTVYASTPRRTSLAALSKLNDAAGLPQPKETTVEFTSQDGYALFAADDAHEQTIPKWSGWPSFAPTVDKGDGLPCAIRLDQCFGREFLDLSDESSTVSASETLKRVAFERTECGDCLIVLLLAKSGEMGLEAFLPLEEEEQAEVPTMEPFAVGLEGTTWNKVDFSPVKDSPLSHRQQVGFSFPLFLSFVLR